MVMEWLKIAYTWLGKWRKIDPIGQGLNQGQNIVFIDINIHPSNLIDEREAARLLGMKISTLRNKRQTGCAPVRYLMSGNRPRYGRKEIAEWLDTRAISKVSYPGDKETIGGFIAERCTTGPDNNASHKAIFEAYAAWCDGSGKRPASSKRMGMDLAERGFERKKSGTVSWGGIGLDKQEHHCHE